MPRSRRGRVKHTGGNSSVVERHLAKVDVAGPTPVSRSIREADHTIPSARQTDRRDVCRRSASPKFRRRTIQSLPLDKRTEGTYVAGPPPQNSGGGPYNPFRSTNGPKGRMSPVRLPFPARFGRRTIQSLPLDKRTEGTYVAGPTPFSRSIQEADHIIPSARQTDRRDVCRGSDSRFPLFRKGRSGWRIAFFI